MSFFIGMKPASRNCMNTLLSNNNICNKELETKEKQ